VRERGWGGRGGEGEGEGVNSYMLKSNRGSKMSNACAW